MFGIWKIVFDVRPEIEKSRFFGSYQSIHIEGTPLYLSHYFEYLHHETPEVKSCQYAFATFRFLMARKELGTLEL